MEYDVEMRGRQIMEFIVEKRKDLRFIGPEYTGVLKGDEETLIHVC